MQGTERRWRFLLGIGRGAWHNVARPFHHQQFGASDDVLVARVRSEALRWAHIPAGQVLVDAHAGCVTLRGQVDRPDDVRRLAHSTARVPRVREVRNYLHLPEATPPNKTEAYEEAARHLPQL